MYKIEKETTVKVIIDETYEIHPKIVECLSKLKLVVYGETKFERPIDLFNTKYVRVTEAGKKPNTSTYFAKVEVEDADDGMEPDGHSDVFLPIFWDVAPNQAGVTYHIIFIDAAFSGGYAKELWLGDRKILTYSVEKGMQNWGVGERVSVGYIEYDLDLDKVYNPHPLT